MRWEGDRNGRDRKSWSKNESRTGKASRRAKKEVEKIEKIKIATEHYRVGCTDYKQL